MATVDVAATETRQIALNLLLNACEASPPGGDIGFAGIARDGAGPAPAGTAAGSGRCRPGAASRFVIAALTELGVMDPRDPPRGLGIRVVRDLVRGLGGRIIARPR